MSRPNRFGCRPSEDVCLEHSEPLIARGRCSKGHDVSEYLPKEMHLTPEEAKALAEEGRQAAAEYVKRTRAMRGPVDYKAELEALAASSRQLWGENQKLQMELAIWKLSHFWGEHFAIILWNTPCVCGHHYFDHEWSPTSECFHSSDAYDHKDCGCSCYQADIRKSPTNRQG